MNGFLRALVNSACRDGAATGLKAQAAVFFLGEMLRRAASEQRTINDEEMQMCLRLNTAALTMGMKVPWPDPTPKVFKF